MDSTIISNENTKTIFIKNCTNIFLDCFYEEDKILCHFETADAKEYKVEISTIFAVQISQSAMIEDFLLIFLKEKNDEERLIHILNLSLCYNYFSKKKWESTFVKILSDIISSRKDLKIIDLRGI